MTTRDKVFAAVAGEDFDNGTPPQSVEDAIHQLDAAKRRLCMEALFVPGYHKRKRRARR